MKPKELLQYESVQYWLEGLSETTKEKCLTQFPIFLEYLEAEGLTTNPDEILKQRVQDLKSEDRKTRRRWEHIVKTWYVKLYHEAEEAGKSTLTPVTYLNRVQSFFSRNEVPLRFKKKELPKPTKKIKMLPFTIEDMKIMYEQCESLRNKALLLTSMQTGLSEIDVCSLNIEDVPGFYKKLKEPPVYIQGYRHKTKVPYQTCIGEDACLCIERMLRARENPEKGPLFLSHKGERLTTRFMHEALNTEAKKLMRAGYKQFKDFETRHLRDLFNDAVARAKLSQKVEDRLLGHKLPGARGDYMLSPSTITEGYLTAYAYLTINRQTHKVEFQWKTLNQLRVDDYVALMTSFKIRYPEAFEEWSEKYKTLIETGEIVISDIDFSTPLPTEKVMLLVYQRIQNQA